jgi:hypothetical protein
MRESWNYTWRCRQCGRPCRGYTPARGDGSIQVLLPHLTPQGVKCANNRSEHYDMGADAITDQHGNLVK